MTPDPSLSGDHQDVRTLLPWYVSNGLDPAERARVEAHLAGCAGCREEVDGERAMARRVAAMPVGVDIGWATLRRRIEAGRALPLRRGPFERLRAAMTGAPRATFVIAAQFLLLVGAVAWFGRPDRPALYHVLSAPTAPAKGNAILMFAPGTPVGRATRLLIRADARVIDGPTETGAFVLTLPDASRQKTLVGLRNDPAVTLAEPLDP